MPFLRTKTEHQSVRALSTPILLLAFSFALAAPGMASASDCDVSGDIPNNVSTATWYGGQHNGHRTSSGEIFDKRKLTAAHPSLPLLSTVEVTNLANGKKVQVRINDRGGMANASEIDLSEAAANSLGIRRCGMGMVVVSAPLPKDKILPHLFWSMGFALLLYYLLARESLRKALPARRGLGGMLHAALGRCGDFSYSLYAVHGPILRAVFCWMSPDHVTKFATLWPALGAIAIALVSAWLFFQLVERWSIRPTAKKQRNPGELSYA